MIDEGVIKFNHHLLEQTSPLPKEEYAELEAARKILYEFNMIGAYSDGIGFGNLSQRKDYSQLYSSKTVQFLISSTQTGHLKDLDGSSYTRVVEFNYLQNSVSVMGPSKASSESLTHASIYDSSESIKCVIHIHHKKIWSKLLEENYPKVPKEIAYGTQQMAEYAQEIVKDGNTNLFVMEGHDEGIIFFENDIQKCLDATLKIYQLFG